jgi:hypothetical protein
LRRSAVYALNVDLDPTPVTQQVTPAGSGRPVHNDRPRAGSSVSIKKVHLSATLALADVFDLELAELPAVTAQLVS